VHLVSLNFRAPGKSSKKTACSQVARLFFTHIPNKGAL